MSYLDELEHKLDDAEACRALGLHGPDECPVIQRHKRTASSLRWHSWALPGAGFAGALAGTWVASNIHMLHHITHAVLRFFGIPCP